MPAMSLARPRTLARPGRSLLLVLALAGACLLPAPAHASDASDLFDKGTAAFTAGNFDEALTHYRAAWKLNNTYDIAYSLALTEVNLGKLRDACEHFAYALAHFPVTGDADLRKTTEEALADAKKSVVTVRVKSTTKDIAVTLDGAPLAADALGTEMFLGVGTHVFEASAPGHRSVKRTLDGTAGSDEDVTINLTPETATGRSATPAFVLGGLGLVGVVAGAVLVASAEGKKSDALALHDEIGTPEGCAAQAAKCKTLRETTAAADGLGNGGVAMFVFGGLAGAAAGLYLVLPSRKPAGPARTDTLPRSDSKTKPTSKTLPGSLSIAVAPTFGPGAGGVLVSGSF